MIVESDPPTSIIYLSKPNTNSINAISIEYYPVVLDYLSTSIEGTVHIISTVGWEAADIEGVLGQVILLKY